MSMQRIATGFLARLAIAAAALGGLAAGAAGDTITLKPGARLDPAASVVTLADIAELEGEHAQSLGHIVVAQVQQRAGVIELNVREVRARLEDANVNWARVNLSGRTVVVRPARPGEALPPLAMTPLSLEESERTHEVEVSSKSEQSAAELVKLPSLRGVIANLVVSTLQVDPGDLRLTFNAADDALLNTLTSAARFEVQPLGSVASDRVDLVVRTWTNGSADAGRRLTLWPRLRVSTAVLRHDVARDAVIFEHDVEVHEQWLAPSQAMLVAGPVEAVGRVATKSLAAGETLREQHVRRDTLVRKGELATVRCLVGGVAISLRAEARADGSEGDIIEFRKAGEREPFTARITGRGQAVVDLSGRSS